MAYPREAININLSEIDSMKQNNYDYLKDYVKNIKICLEAYAVAAKISKKENKINSVSPFRGLGN